MTGLGHTRLPAPLPGPVRGAFSEVRLTLPLGHCDRPYCHSLAALIAAGVWDCSPSSRADGWRLPDVLAIPESHEVYSMFWTPHSLKSRENRVHCCWAIVCGTVPASGQRGVIMTLKSFFVLMLLALLVACGPSEPETVIQTVVHTRIAEVEIEVTRLVEVEVTREVAVTREVEVTRETEVTVMVERPVTVTPTPTPENSPTPSNTPTITLTPSNTPTPTPSSTPTITPVPTWTPDYAQTATIEAFGELTSPKGNGFYLVGTDIAPGKWESTGTRTQCYWARYDSAQETLANHYGLAGCTITIRSTDHQVELNDCGIWYYVEGAERPLADDATEPKGNGFYTVGVEIAPGQWKSTGTGDGCYWARLDAYQDTLDNHYGMSGGTMTIWASDYEVEFNDCGTWEYLGP